jgi:hypothetical protein
MQESEQRALVAALEQADLRPRGDATYRQEWRLAALQEAALGDEAEVGYAFSPRSTRGATRA